MQSYRDALPGWTHFIIYTYRMADYTPTEQETTNEKARLINLVRPKLKEHGLVDLTDFINRKSTEGFRSNHGFTRSVAYKLEEMGEAEVIVRKEWTEFYVKRNIFSKRRPYLFATLLATIGVIFSIIAGLTNAIVSSKLNKSQQQKEIQQLKQKQQDLSEDITNLGHYLKDVQDTLAKYKHWRLLYDTILLTKNTTNLRHDKKDCIQHGVFCYAG